MVTATSRWDATLRLLFSPRLLLQGLVEYASGWLFTRNWLWLFLIYSPLAILILGVAGIVGYGVSLSRETMVERYVSLVEEELPRALSALEGNVDEDAEDAVDPGQPSVDTVDNSERADEDDQPAVPAETVPPSDEDLESVSDYGELLLRRLLQLNQDNTRATFLVAAQLGGKGRSGQARQMMRRIAPEGGGGFAPAHAWLASFQVQNGGLNTPEDWTQFQADMDTALRWKLTDPRLVQFYAVTLAGLDEGNPAKKRDNVSRALDVLGKAAQQHSELQVALANLAAEYGRKRRMQRAADTAKERIRDRMEAGEETLEDLIELANLFLLDEAPDKALNVCKMAFERDPNNEAVRRLRSEAFRLKYMQSVQWDGQNAQLDLALLDAALKSDPTNPGVSVEIAKLIAAGKDAPPEFKKSLQRQLASGQATALAHILLADRSLMDGKISDAIPHLRAALHQSPNNPLVLNNLALAVAKTDPESLDQALEYSQRAVNLMPENPEFLDTLAEIRLLKGDKLGALESYEAAIGRGGKQLATRRSLANLYRDLGMAEMADAQEAEIAKQQE